jgi:hypothetical protein
MLAKDNASPEAHFNCAKTRGGKAAAEIAMNIVASFGTLRSLLLGTVLISGCSSESAYDPFDAEFEMFEGVWVSSVDPNTNLVFTQDHNLVWLVGSKPWGTTMRLVGDGKHSFRVEYLYDEEGGKMTPKVEISLSADGSQLTIHPTIDSRMGGQFRRLTWAGKSASHELGRGKQQNKQQK